MARILLLLVIAFVIYLLFRGFFRAQVKKDAPPPPATTTVGEDMVTCTRCGVNLPRSDARTEDGKLVCASNPQCK